MPSTRSLSVLVALLVVFAGCNALPGGGDGSNAQSGPPEHGVAFLSTSTHAFNATVSVTDSSGETIVERDLSFDGLSPRYVALTTVNTTGNVTVHVDTDLPAVGGDTMSANRTVTVDPGPETTIVHANFQEIEFVTGTAQRKAVEVPVSVNWVTHHSGEVSYTVYRNQTAVDNGSTVATASGKNPKRVGSVNSTGVYWVAANTNLSHETNYGIGVINESTRELVVSGYFEEGLLISFAHGEGNDGGFAKQPPMAESETDG